MGVHDERDNKCHLVSFDKTKRGFSLGKFKDLYGMPCTIQESSLATDDAIWLGVSDPKPRIMASEAAEAGVETNQTTGWVDYPIPDNVLLSTRMHLNRKQVAALIPLLQHFVDTGEL